MTRKQNSTQKQMPKNVKTRGRSPSNILTVDETNRYDALSTSFP